jgi:hypothetical protein
MYVYDDLPSNICFSSTIAHLRIRMLTFDDCLCLLDGRLCQMNTSIVTIDYCMSFARLFINNTVKKVISSFISLISNGFRSCHMLE